MSATTEEVVAGRDDVYGKPTDTMVRIAAMWSALLDTQINPIDVPLMMMALKLLRCRDIPDYSDSYDDIEGYLDIARQVVGPDMVRARTVKDYLRVKAARKLLDD